MNIKNYKTTISISFGVMVSLFLLLSGCYTQLDTTSLEKSKSRNYPVQGDSIDYKIIGAWQKTIHWMDAPDQVQQIIFDTNHNILFEENFKSTYGDKLSGTFSTKDSILTIILDYGYGTEKYYYEVVNEKLTLTPIYMNSYFPYKVSGSGSQIWINPHFKKGNL